MKPETLAESIRVMQLLALYGELLSADSNRAGFIPWDGRSTIEVIGGTWLRANRTPSVPDRILQPLLATCAACSPRFAPAARHCRKPTARAPGCVPAPVTSRP